MEFTTLVENQTVKKIKIFRSNNSGEYTSNEFIYFCKKEGIKKEMIVPYNPKQNGEDERKNRSIVEAIMPCYMIKSFKSSFREK